MDLSERRFSVVDTPEKLARSFLGGRGLGAALLWNSLPPGTDPLAPQNPLIFACGPATGTPLPSCARSELVTKSPLTGTYLCSSAGGFFGAGLKHAGFDAVVIVGRAPSATWLLVSQDGVEFRDATDLWGLTTDETERRIKREVSSARVSIASIGPAGENLVRFASIITDLTSGGRPGAFGRGGGGAVMGFKRLKAIAVVGERQIEIADEDGFARFLQELREKLRESEAVQNFSRWGTPQFVGPINEARLWPTRNFQRGSFDGADRLTAHRMRAELVKRDTACYACSIASGKLSEVESGPYAGTLVDGPEYETIWSFGPNCGVDRLDAIAAANLWCDRYGLDTISAGCVIAFAMECAERRLLQEEGLEIRFGNHEVILPLLERITFRRGVGDLLAQGVARAAERIGGDARYFAMHVKGSEIPAYDPRGAWGMALAYATSCRGACHLKAWTIGAEILKKEYDRFSTAGKAELVIRLQDERAVVDSTGVCVFGSRVIRIPEIREMLRVITGWTMSEAELLRVGERIYNLERMLAVRDGVSRKDDTLPPRLLLEPLPELPESKLDPAALERMLDEYYRLRGWDQQGRPTEEKLKELGLPEILR